ncbi:MAG: histidinol-phosphate transaminase [Halorhodospira sp.]
MAAPEPDLSALANPSVRGLAPYEPGKPMEALRREYGVDEVIKLASNENPLGPSPRAVEAAAAAVSGSHRYPDGSGLELRSAVAERHGVGPERVTLGNGSNDVLVLLAQAFLGPGRTAVLSAHAFAVYPIATQAVGAAARVVPARPAEAEQPYGHDLEAMLAAAAEDETVRVVFVANPNNPTGTWLTEGELRGFLDRLPARVIAVVDEAYFEYAAAEPGYPDASRWLDAYPSLVVTRSLSKAHGLAGLRVGYGLSHPSVAELLGRVRQPFNCSAPAQAAAVASLADTEHLERSAALNGEQREALRRGLVGLGLEPLPSVGNFLTFDAGPRAGAIHEGLLRSGIIVRPVDAYDLPNHLRVSVGTPEENQALLAALSRQVQEASA